MSRAQPVKRRVRRRNLPNWQAVTLLSLSAELPGSEEKLTVSIWQVDRRTWVSAAVSSSVPGYVPGSDPRRALDGLFDNHAHDTLPTATTQARAMRQAERYARAWLRRPRPVAPPCECKPIDKAAAE